MNSDYIFENKKSSRDLVFSRKSSQHQWKWLITIKNVFGTKTNRGLSRSTTSHLMRPFNCVSSLCDASFCSTCSSKSLCSLRLAALSLVTSSSVSSSWRLRCFTRWFTFSTFNGAKWEQKVMSCERYEKIQRWGNQ